MANTDTTSIAKKPVRVRIAPSPTGVPHIGNTRTALFDYLFAKHMNGTFLLRIEDTDRARLVPESLAVIEEILSWLGLPWDEKYMQSERLALYKKYADELIAKNMAYADNGAIRFKMPKEGETTWHEIIGNKEINFKNDTQEDFVIIKSDGYPTYNFANVIDDHLMEITHVLRGYEFISSTPKHIQLYNAFGWEHPVFVHLPVILGPDHQKLSKRHGAKSALDYRKEGYLKEALLNFMVLLGWNPGGDKELMDVLEMIALFDLKDINSASPIFDSKKLLWMNGLYIRKFSVGVLLERIQEQAKLLGISLTHTDKTILEKLVVLAQTRMKTLNEFFVLAEPFLTPAVYQLTEEEKRVAKDLAYSFSHAAEWNAEAILGELKKIMEEKQIKMPMVYKIVTGKESGLPLPQTLEIFGKEQTIKRLHNVSV